MAHILIIDDSGYFRNAARLALCKAGHIVTFAFDGEAGEQAAEQQPFDALIVGVSLPVTDGVQVLSRLRRRGIDAPAVAVGTELGEPTRARLGTLGVVRTIDRFAPPRSVVEAVELALSHALARAA